MAWEKFPFKFEKQYRLKNWDYSNDGFYFITICTKNRANYFGNFKNNVVELSQVGIITQRYLLQIPIHYKDVSIDEFSIMPNHIHMLLNKGISSGRNMPWSLNKNISSGRNMPWSLNKNISSGRNMPWSLNKNISSGRNMPWSLNKNISSGRNMPWHVPTNNVKRVNNFSQPIKNSISMVVNHYKSAVTKETNKLNLKFAWQTRFHDEIIINKKHYWAVKQYIRNNTLNWDKDKENI